MKIFIAGASGYIGGTVARRLISAGRELRGLVRDVDKARRLAAIGVAPVPGKKARVAIDTLVRGAGRHGLRTVAICSSKIYGTGRGPARDGAQIPGIANRARESGIGRHAGRGQNIWSNVHVEDVAEVFHLATEMVPRGSFYLAENGEASCLDICAEVARRLGLGGPQVWPFDEAARELGETSAA